MLKEVSQLLIILQLLLTVDRSMHVCENNRDLSLFYLTEAITSVISVIKTIPTAFWLVISSLALVFMYMRNSVNIFSFLSFLSCLDVEKKVPIFFHSVLEMTHYY